MSSLYTVNEITEWLSEYLKEQGFRTEVYSDKFLPARVPLYADRNSGSKKSGQVEEIAVDVINSQSIKSSDFFYPLTVYRTLNKKGLEFMDASSAIFFQHYFPRAKIYWAYPDYVERDDEFLRFLELCRDYSVGLFKVGKKGVEEDASLSPKPLIGRTLDRLDSEIAKMKEAAKRGTIGLFDKVIHEVHVIVDEHVEETNKYLVYYPEPEYRRREIIGRTEGRNISLTLVDRVGEVETLSYKEELKEISDKYRSHIEDDYEIALDLIRMLWKRTGLEYPEFQKDFEPVLLLNPRYRDHFLHQLHVFLLGAYILDRMHGDKALTGFREEFGAPIEDIWLLASTYHDYNYNIQNYNEWIARFFRNALFLKENPSHLKLDECYVKEDYMFKTKELCDAFELKVDRTTLLFFYEKIINSKNHGLLGALSLLKLFDQKRVRKISYQAIVQGARAVALHDEDIWQHFSGRGGNGAGLEQDVKEILEDFSGKKALVNLRFEDDPLSFLLIFCDTIQEWGRVGRDYEETGARLDDIGFSENVVWANISVSNVDAFDKKKSEIKRVKKFLCDERFKIRLSSREELGSDVFERYMDGK